MKRAIAGALPRLLFLAAAVAAVSPVILACLYPAGPDFLHVRFNSWFVFVLGALTLALDGVAGYLWWRLRRTDRALTDLAAQPLRGDIPSIAGHKHLDRAEFLSLLQILFSHPSYAKGSAAAPADVKYVQVEPLPGGHGGSATVLARLRREQSSAPLPQSLVVKLGQKREMAGEHDKFQTYVRWHLPGAARFVRYAEWEDFAAIAYEFVGLDPDHDIQSLLQFYEGHTPAEVSELIGEVYGHLARAWYRSGRTEPTDLYQEYDLLRVKRERIIEHVERLVDEDDRYRRNFTVARQELQRSLRPGFCPALDIPWRDPVAFLRTWPKQDLTIPIHRSTVHGDLHARNVLVEIEGGGQRHAWFIDFSHTGNGLSQDRTREAERDGTLPGPDAGHTLRDFCRLEADVKFVLTRLCDGDDLGLAVAFERELIRRGMALPEWQVALPSVEALADERFKKAWHAIREIRRRASTYLVNVGDLRPYHLSLLHATLPIVYYHRDQFDSEACERQQKRCALLSAGMLCSQL